MTSIARKTTAAESARIDRVRNASPMYLAFCGMLPDRRDLDVSDRMWSELDYYGTWDVNSDGGAS